VGEVEVVVAISALQQRQILITVVSS